MKKLLCTLILMGVAFTVSAADKLKVFASVPEWAALAKEIGGDRVEVFTATQALQDPHHIEARPSLIARARNADVLIATGADLEIGWLPLVLRESGNRAIQPGQPAYFEAAAHVRMLEVPGKVDRADGDVHAAGNPHIQTAPRNLLAVATAFAATLSRLDPAAASIYAANAQRFDARMRAAIARWEQLAVPLHGMQVVVQHKSFSYLLAWLGMVEIGTLEPKPGIEPSPAHLSRLLAQSVQRSPRAILRTPYHAPTAANWFAAQSKLPILVLPFTVGGNAEAGDLFALFDDTLAQLLKTIP